MKRRFLRAAVVDSSFYELPLLPIERDVYFYLCSRCASRWHVSEGEMCAALRHCPKRIRSALEVLLDMHLIQRWKFARPRCSEYRICLTTEKSWGIGCKRTVLIGCKRTVLRGANAPIDRVQTHLPNTTIDKKRERCGDSALLEMATRNARAWPFCRRPIGSTGIITAKHQLALLEMMRTLVNHGWSQSKRLESLLRANGEYLAMERDVLSDDGRDYRAKSFGAWLAHWSDNIHRAQTFLELKESNVVKISTGVDHLNGELAK